MNIRGKEKMSLLKCAANFKSNYSIWKKVGQNARNSSHLSLYFINWPKLLEIKIFIFFLFEMLLNNFLKHYVLKYKYWYFYCIFKGNCIVNLLFFRIISKYSNFINFYCIYSGIYFIFYFFPDPEIKLLELPEKSDFI